MTFEHTPYSKYPPFLGYDVDKKGGIYHGSPGFSKNTLEKAGYLEPGVQVDRPPFRFCCTAGPLIVNQHGRSNAKVGAYRLLLQGESSVSNDQAHISLRNLETILPVYRKQNDRTVKTQKRESTREKNIDTKKTSPPGGDLIDCAAISGRTVFRGSGVMWRLILLALSCRAQAGSWRGCGPKLLVDLILPPTPNTHFCLVFFEEPGVPW